MRKSLKFLIYDPVPVPNDAWSLSVYAPRAYKAVRCPNWPPISDGPIEH